ncbi:MAG TPA: hypothetical protein VNO30_47000 [Kofleriaceae bacterium]|nr:hypothetical protein [Kofleriaceae bacterium]
MKKTNTKLHLKTNTIRMLQTDALDRVNGGGSFTCTDMMTGCSHPPQHQPGSGNPHNNGNGNGGNGGNGNPGNP